MSSSEKNPLQEQIFLLGKFFSSLQSEQIAVITQKLKVAQSLIAEVWKLEMSFCMVLTQFYLLKKKKLVFNQKNWCEYQRHLVWCPCRTFNIFFNLLIYMCHLSQKPMKLPFCEIPRASTPGFPQPCCCSMGFFYWLSRDHIICW